MCGIIGIVGESAASERARLILARDTMVHRGPDDAGVWEAPGVVLGARRLSIIDLTPAGHQPMVSEDGRSAIVYNGEIYNFQELRRELEQRDRFQSRTDTEVLLRGYRAWGLQGLLDRADGMFAFAIWDGARRRLIAARDRAGKKPFFYFHQGRTFYFASVVSALRPLLPGPLDVDLHALDAFLVYQAVPAPMAIFRGVRQLEPAHHLTFDAASGQCTMARYWRLSFAPKTTAPEHEVVDRVEQLVRTSVQQRLVADVPVGAFLSGGVDSSLVTTLAAQESATPIEAVTLGFSDPRFDERRYARAVAAAAGVRLHEELMQPELVADLPAIVHHYGQPVADVSIVPNHYLAQVARQWMRVILNGDGGDEMFGGYRRPMVEFLSGPIRERVPEATRRRIAAGLEQLGEAGWTRNVKVLARAASMPAADAFTYDRAFRLMRSDAYAPPLREAVGDWHPDQLYRDAWHSAEALNDVDRALAGDFTTYLPDQLLTKADRASMAYSLEARSPLLDTPVMEYAARIPNSLRFHNLETKYVLKRVAARHVPAHAIYRRKRGFVMPASTWLRGELAPYVRAALDNPVFYDRGWLEPAFVRRMLEEHFTGARDWGEHVFTLLVLEVWARITLDGTLGSDARMDAFLSRPGQPSRRTIRTLQIGLEWFPERQGGLNRVYYELARHLPAAGVGVHGLVAGTSNVWRDSAGRVEAFATAASSIPERWYRLSRRGRATVTSDPERLVVTHFALYAYPLLPALRDRPFVVHFQGPWGLEGRAEGQGALMVAAKTAVERAVYRKATAFIVLSTPFGRILQDTFGVDASRIHVIPGGVDVNRFAIATPRDAARRHLGWPADRRIVLAVRRLTHRMGLDNLLAAVPAVAAAVPDALVLIAGRGPLAGRLEHRIRELGIAQHARVVGFIPDDDLPVAYRAADLTVVPSVELEGFGLIVAESFAAGTPCVVTPVGGLPEAAGALSPHLVLGGSTPEHLAHGLVDALARRHSLPTADQCTAFARERYDWPVIANQVRAVYEAALR